jgi:hypothetical protein
MEGGKVHKVTYLTLTDFFQVHHVPPSRATQAPSANQQTKKPQKKPVRQSDDSSEDEFLKKLAEDDDDDDMAELFKGFVGPKKTQQHASHATSSKNQTKESDIFTASP